MRINLTTQPPPVKVPVEFTDEHRATLRNIIHSGFFDSLELSNFSSTFPLPWYQAVLGLCAEFGVDGTSKVARLRFFEEVVEETEAIP